MVVTSYPTSIITRIETNDGDDPFFVPIAFLPHFHYNKDWNSDPAPMTEGDLKGFLPHFHYNKDWNNIQNTTGKKLTVLLTPLPL